MGKDLQADLKAFEPQHEFFVGIDSDGCAFNSMEVKDWRLFLDKFIKCGILSIYILKHVVLIALKLLFWLLIF